MIYNAFILLTFKAITQKMLRSYAAIFSVSPISGTNERYAIGRSQCWYLRNFRSGVSMCKYILLILLIGSTCYADNFYLDSYASGANDGTSWENAWESFGDVKFGASAGQVGAGDTLYISGGSTTKTYKITSAITPVSGSEGSPVTIKISEEAGHNGIAVIDGSYTLEYLLYLGGKSYLTIDGRVSGDTRTLFGDVTAYNPHIKLQNWGRSDDSDLKTYAILGVGSWNYVNLYGLWIYNDDTCRDSTCSEFGTMVKRYGMYTVGSTNNCIISDCEFDGTIVNTLVLGSGPGTAFDSNIIEKNLITTYYNQNGYGGADGIKPGGGTTVRYNFVDYEEKNNAVFNPGHNGEDGIQINPGQNYIKVYNNIVESVLTSLRIDTQSGESKWCNHIWIWSNLFYGGSPTYPSQRAIDVDAGSLIASDKIIDVKIYNNTILDMNSYSVGLWSGLSNYVDIEFKNNILVNCSPTDKSINLQGTGDTSLRDVNYNLMLESDLSTREYIWDQDAMKYVSQTHDPYDSGKVMAFTSYTIPKSEKNNLTLATTATMAIGTGINLGSTFEYDITGTARGTLWNLGAYESTKDGLLPPTNLTVK